MSRYKVYCNECSDEFSLIGEKVPLYCCMCGEEVSDADTVNDAEEFSEDEWDRISRESLDDIEDWKD